MPNYKNEMEEILQYDDEDLALVRGRSLRAAEDYAARYVAIRRACRRAGQTETTVVKTVERLLAAPHRSDALAAEVVALRMERDGLRNRAHAAEERLAKFERAGVRIEEGGVSIPFVAGGGKVILRSLPEAEPKPDGIKVGDIVRVTEGARQGQVGTVARVEGRCSILVKFETVQLWKPQFFLERAPFQPGDEIAPDYNTLSPSWERGIVRRVSWAPHGWLVTYSLASTQTPDVEWTDFAESLKHYGK